MAHTEGALAAFRAETREWLESSCPESMRAPVTDMGETMTGGRSEHFTSEDQRVWFERCRERGWIAPGWPTEYGGGGLDQAHCGVLKAEMRRLRCRVPHSNLGLSMIGPVLLEIGTEEQKREHLPPIARGEILWSQGFSEPGAGSDLASLKTRAEIDGDEFVVTGSKIWTTMADRSDWMFCLVRTDPDAPKHQGISFVLFDMHSPEVSTRPIRLISGESHFCQTFLDGVRVARRNLVGELNQGWSVAKQLLVHERNMMGDIRYGDRTPPLPKLLARIPEGDGERRRALRERVARVEMDDRALGLTLSRLMGEIAEGTTAPAVSSILKYYGTEAQKRKMRLAMELLGNRGLAWEGDAFAADELATARSWLLSYTGTIAGGSSEVQLNIISKRVLGLPVE